jgi:hypothetical protein
MELHVGCMSFCHVPIERYNQPARWQRLCWSAIESMHARAADKHKPGELGGGSIFVTALWFQSGMQAD